MSVDPSGNVPANLDANDDTLLRPKTNQNSSKMFSIGKELCFILLIAFTTYASFNKNENVATGPVPTPFFSKGSIIGDFYKGEISEALFRAKEGDVGFIMYYAPWDAESQLARKHFEVVAHQHYKQVYFAGVNCWQPNGECKRQLNKVMQFPRLLGYLTHESGIEFRGPVDVRYMNAFLQKLKQPLYRLTGASDLVRLRSTYNAVVVGYINFHGMLGGMPYRAIYETALKYLDRNIVQEVAFAVVTSFKTAMEMGIDTAPSIKLYLWNETLDYRDHFRTDHLVQWVSSQLHQVTLALTPPGVKSITLGQYVTQGPALIMFTPYENFAMYDLLREVALEYYNCNKRADISELARNVSNSVSERIAKERRTMVLCQSQAHSVHQRVFSASVQIKNTAWANLSCSQRCSPTSQCCKHHFTMSSVGTPPEVDPLSSPALTAWAWRERCRNLSPPPSRVLTTTLPPTVQGLACRYNRTITMLSLDSTLFYRYAKGLGVTTSENITTVVMTDPQMETTHILESPITRESLGWFLVNFTEGKLERLHRIHLPRAATANLNSPNTISITELTSDTFLPVVMNHSMNVVVMYYSPYCAFCRGLSTIFLTTARLLRNVPNLQFCRIDGERNDLPWQFTAPQYPTILFFAAHRKEESRVFPTSEVVTVDSMTKFVMANLHLEARLSAMMQVCQMRFPHQVRQLRECLVEVRKKVMESISVHLSRHRALNLRFPPSKERNYALRKELSTLQFLKQLQLTLSVRPSVHWKPSQPRAARDEL